MRIFGYLFHYCDLPFANILIQETGTGVTSDFDGKYSFELPAGTYSIQFSFVGYETKIITEIQVGGDEYTIADMANYAWFGACVLHNIYEAAEFLDVVSYKNVTRWAEEIEARPAVARGRRVNRPWGDEATRVAERHDASDFD